MAAAGALAAFVATFAFRWLTLSEFPNDHFDHLAMAQQLLLGALPVRDFTDEGLPLMYGVSAAAWALVKSPFLSEALVVCTGFATAAAVSFVVATRASRSAGAAALAVAAQVALYPRTYSYQKLLVQALAVGVAWWASAHLTMRRIAALSAVTALGYYFRHDHALYLGAALVTLLVVALWPGGARVVARAVATYLGLALLFVAPHLLYVQWAAGLPTYFAISREYVAAEAQSGAYRAPRFALDLESAFVPTVNAPTVSIRWVASLDEDSRATLERQYGLEAMEHTDATTWRYRVRDTSAEHLRAVRSDPRVDDTHGFDELASTATRGSWRPTSLGPGWHLRANSLALLYWLCWIGPLGAMALLIRQHAGGRHRPTDPAAARLAMLAVLALCASAGYLRSPLDTRLPDVAVPHTILGAWVATTLWRWPGSSAVPRRLRRGAVVMLTIGTFTAVALVANTPQLIAASGLNRGIGATVQRWRDVSAQLRSTPGPVPSNPSVILMPFFDYVEACTAPGDRLLYAWYAPDVYIVADRGFAGDHRKLFAPFHSTDWEQARTIARLREQRVPFVIIPSERKQSFEETYQALWNYVRERYVPMATLGEEPHTFEIFREASWTSASAHGATGWPCASPQATAERSQ